MYLLLVEMDILLMIPLFERFADILPYLGEVSNGILSIKICEILDFVKGAGI